MSFMYGVMIKDDKYNEGIKEYKKDNLGQEAKALKTLVEDAKNDPSLDTIKAAIEQFKKIQKKIDDLT